MKKVLYTLIVVALLFLGYFVSRKTDHVKAVESYFYRVNTTATTTATFMTPGTATSTLTMNTWNVDKADVWIHFIASSTASTLQWQYQYSNDNVTWYNEDYTIAPTTLGVATFEHASTTITHRWTPGTTATSTKVVTIPDISSNFKRAVFSLVIGSANGRLWTDATIKSNAQ